MVASTAVPLALTGYEIGLLASALVFIFFALVVALVVPRSRPEFPSKYLGWFIAACIVLFAVQMTAVILLAELGEEEHEEVGGGDRAGGADGAFSDRACSDDRDDRTTTEPRADRAHRPTPSRPSRPRARATRSPGRTSSSRPAAAAAAIRSPMPAPPARSARTSTRRCRPSTCGRSRDERRRRHAPVQGHPERAADPGRRRVRLLAPQAASRAPGAKLGPLGEVSERPKERDWKSRTSYAISSRAPSAARTPLQAGLA